MVIFDVAFVLGVVGVDLSVSFLMSLTIKLLPKVSIAVVGVLAVVLDVEFDAQLEMLSI